MEDTTIIQSFLFPTVSILIFFATVLSTVQFNKYNTMGINQHILSNFTYGAFAF